MNPPTVANELPPHPRSVDRGSTFIEVVVAVVLLALIAVPVLSSVSTVIRASSVARSASNVETAVINSVDRVNRAEALTNQICDYYPYARAAVVTQGWPDTAVSVANEHLVVSTNVWAPGGCPAGGYVRGLVQRVTITVTDPDQGVTRTIKVVKSDV